MGGDSGTGFLFRWGWTEGGGGEKWSKTTGERSLQLRKPPLRCILDELVPMTGIHSSDDRGPWFTVAGHSIHAPALLVGGFIVSMLVTTAAMSLNDGGLLKLVAFSSEGILGRLEVWRLFTYVLWNPPTLWFAIDMLMLWWFGRELESFFGRRIFLKLCAGLILVPSLTGLIVGWVTPLFWVGMPGNFSLFVAYATLLPGAPLLFGVSAMWTAVVFLGLQVLSYLTGHHWGEMVVTVAGAGFAFGYVRFQQGRWVVPPILQILSPVRKPRFRVLERVPRPASGRNADQSTGDREDGDAVEAIDPLLEKIARSGLASLTSGERKQLQLAREALLRRESSRH